MRPQLDEDRQEERGEDAKLEVLAVQEAKEAMEVREFREVSPPEDEKQMQTSRLMLAS